MGLWRKSVVNHLYYVAAEAPEGEGREETAEAMWRSVVNHVQDIHEHDNILFPMCGHAHLHEETRQKQWLEPGTKKTTK